MNFTNDIQQAMRLTMELETLATRIAHMKEDFERAVEQATPIEGWPGKNAEARDAAKAAWINHDDQCQALRTDIRNGEIRLAQLKADMAAFELERRDREWGIRRDLIGVLREHGATAALPF